MQGEEPPVMTTGLERIAVKARCEPKLRFTWLAHHITKERIWESLSQIPAKSAAGVDGQTVTEAQESFEEWIAAMLQSVHRKGYRAPEIRRVYIPKPGKQEMRPLGVPTVADRALQRSASQVLSAIYELSLSFSAACRIRSSAVGASLRLGVRDAFAVAASPWSNLFPPSSPPSVARLCSRTSSVVQVCPTSYVRSSSASVLGLPDASQAIFAMEERRISRFPCKVLRCVLGVCDRAELGNASR
jgi:hypothetical protein